MRVLATAMLGGLAILALSLAARADTVSFNARLASDTDNSPQPMVRPGAARGSAALSLDTATKLVRWTIEYSGLARAPQGVSCGALEAPGGPAIRLTSNLASPITGSKALTEPEIAALTSGGWVCVIGGEGDEAEIGGMLQPAR